MDVFGESLRSVARHLRITFVAGIIVLVPVVITFVVIRWLFNIIDGLLQPAIERAFDRTLPGLGIVLLLIILYGIGLLWASVVGKQMIGWAQTALLNVPVINAIYRASKDLIESFSGQGPTGFNRVVLIEYPRTDAWAIGFLTGIAKDEQGILLGIIYIPTAPTPQSGWVAIVPMDQVFDLDMSVAAAMRLVLSGGILSPTDIAKRPAADREPTMNPDATKPEWTANPDATDREPTTNPDATDRERTTNPPG